MRATILKNLFRPIVQRFSRSANGRYPRQRRCTRIRARHTVLWAVFTLVLLHGGLLTLALTSPTMRDPVYREREQMLLARLKTEQPSRSKLVLVMGTSRAGNAFDARSMEEILRIETGQPIVAFNFAVPGEGPITQQIYLRRLLQKGIRPDYLIVEVLHLQFYDFGCPQEGGTIIANRLMPSEPELVARYGVPIAACERSLRDLWLNPWGESRLSVLLRWNDKMVPHDDCIYWNRQSDAWGWRPFEDDSSNRADYARKLAANRKSYSHFVRDFQANTHAVNALKDLLDLCRQERIEVMLVQLPESSEFRSWYTPQSKRAIVDLFASIAEERKAEWVDAQTWVPDGNYLDGHHLLRGGAIHFTRRFSREAVVPWLKAEQTQGAGLEMSMGDR